MDDLTAFITARLDEDEAMANAVANAAARSVWTSSGAHVFAAAKPGRPEVPITGYLPDGMADHIARHDPARVLREVAARRRTLERHRNCGHGVGYCDDGGHGWYDDARGALCNEKLDLAAAWSDHPDYREEWKPQP